MLSKKNILRSTLCTILFIAVTSSASIDVQEVIFDPISYPDLYREDDYGDPVGVYEYSYRKTKRQASNVLRREGDDLLAEARIPLTTQKLKEILQILKKPKKSGFLTLNGWSASGMPFNVLYIPNTLQQKFLAAMNVMAEKKPSVSVPTSQPLRIENQIGGGKDDKKEYLRGSMAKTSNRSPQIRRHYLVIPQLFVSYGWGSAGK